MNLAVRVTRSYVDVSDWVTSIKADNVAVFEHEKDDEINRTHIHMLLIGSELKPDALKARYKKLYGTIDAKDWSFKTAETDTDRFITYMSKGVLLPKFIHGYSVEDIAQFTAKWVSPRTMVQLENGKFVRHTEEPPKKAKIELLEQMRSQLCDSDSTRCILKKIRKVLVDNKQVIGQYKMLDYYDSLMMYSRKDEWLNSMERKINSRV